MSIVTFNMPARPDVADSLSQFFKLEVDKLKRELAEKYKREFEQEMLALATKVAFRVETLQPGATRLPPQTLELNVAFHWAAPENKETKCER